MKVSFEQAKMITAEVMKRSEGKIIPMTKLPLDNIVFDKRGQDLVERPDAYAWTIEKVAKAKNKKKLGFHSTEGALTYAELLSTIEDEHEREIFTDLLVNWARDLVLIHTDKEHRLVIQVTKELAEEFTEIPNSYDIEWPEEGATGVELTPIREGDALVIEECSFGPAFYVVQGEEYRLTHAKGHI